MLAKVVPSDGNVGVQRAFWPVLSAKNKNIMADDDQQVATSAGQGDSNETAVAQEEQNGEVNIARLMKYLYVQSVFASHHHITQITHFLLLHMNGHAFEWTETPNPHQKKQSITECASHCFNDFSVSVL